MDPKLTEEEIAAFVGKHADYYCTRWTPLIEGQNWTAFNWPAFFLSAFWLPYRKMYTTTFVFYVCIFLAAMVEEVASKHGAQQSGWHYLRLVAAIIVGANANRWYFDHATNVILEHRSKRLPDDVFMDELSKRGGTSIGAAVAFFVTFVAALAVVFFLMRAV